MTGVAIITGAGSGVGRSAALALQGAGWNVALVGRRQAQLDETAGMAATGGGDTLAIPTDVTDADAVEAMTAQTVARFGRLDFLFNNAGRGSPPLDIDETPVEDWKAVVDVNLTGSFLCARAAFGQFKRQTPKGGRIVNNGSISAHAPRPGSIGYTATKHAITGLTKTLALDGRKHDIACGQIDIGNALTDLAARMADGVPQADGSVRPEPLMDVDHVGRAILHMASLPLDANIPFLTIKATKMPWEGRG